MKKVNEMGFPAFYPRCDAMYLSKLYLKKEYRGKGFARAMPAFVINAAEKENKKAIELNVNKNNVSILIYEKLGFVKIRDEKNDIGNGFFMDDYVYRLELK
ncbi:MAG: GNAT family N-acetyltransferase [Firmicutes bacterium]|nr:GNAT family N-acetyltransferase [Bacillota bacterium]